MRGALRALRDELNEATMRLRDVVAGLDGAMTPAAFVDTLRSLIASRAERHGIDWSVEVDGPVEDIGDDERAELLRVLNEAVSNVVRHADATQVDVDARGRGRPHPPGGGGRRRRARRRVGARGMGLRNLAARADERRGDWRGQARPGGGTRLAMVGAVRGRAVSRPG